MDDRHVHFSGTCGICGEPISFTWDTQDGVIDHDLEQTADGSWALVTWIRHLGGPRPACEVFASDVREVL